MNRFLKRILNGSQNRQESIDSPVKPNNEKKIRIAACALLVEIGKADSNFTHEERKARSRTKKFEFVNDYDESFFENEGIEKLQKIVDDEGSNLPSVNNEIRLGPPIFKPSKIICVGLNYASHAKESGMQVPSEPVLFFKAPSAVTGPNDNIIIPKNSIKTDWEVELAIVIGRRGTYIDEANAFNHIAGYFI